MVERELDQLALTGPRRRLFDLGCGNGSVAHRLSQRGWQVTGVDPSLQGIAQAHQTYPGLALHLGSGYDDLRARFGRFPVVLCLEVLQNVYDPARVAERLFDLLEPGGTALVAVQYHGYWKNLCLALLGKLDAHFDALYLYGQIKFFSIRTLGRLLEQAGFEGIRFRRIGRLPPLAAVMLAVARRPAQEKQGNEE
jgi:2-polyprenyl-6-hydroxyphenyl methylase/3-demethylubiquinone-9 3-methyltransferase